MFLDLPVSCGQNKNQSFVKTDILNVVSDFLQEWLVLAVRSFEDIYEIHIIGTF